MTWERGREVGVPRIFHFITPPFNAIAILSDLDGIYYICLRQLI